MSVNKVDPARIPGELSGAPAPEAVFRQFFAYNLFNLSKTVDEPDNTFFEELFSQYGVGEVKRIKTWFRDHPNIQVNMSWPRQDVSLPYVSVVNAGEVEAEGEWRSWLDDYGGEANFGEYTRRLKSIPEKMTIQVLVGANDPQLTIYLTSVLKAVLLVNKEQFEKFANIHNLSYSIRDLDSMESLSPEFAYMKTLTITFDTTFDVPLDPVRTKIGGVNVSLKAAYGFTVAVPGLKTDSGPASVVDVPSSDE